MGENPGIISTKTKKIPSRVKLNYAILVASTTIMATIGANLAKYYTDFVGMSAALFGYAQLAFAFVNSFNDPAIGSWIDKTPHTRRKNKFTWYILLAIPFLLIGMGFQILGQPSWPPVLLFLTVFLGYSIYDSGIAMFGISKGSLIIDASSSDVERSSVESISLVFQTLFGIAGFLLPTYFLTGDSTQTQAILMFVGFAVVGIILYSITASRFRKNAGTLVQLRIDRIEMDRKFIFRRMIHQRSYILYMACAFLIVGIQANNQVFMLYYMDNFLDLESKTITIVSGIFLPIYLITYAIGPTLIKKIGVKSFLLIGQCIAIIGYIGVLMGVTGYLAFGFLLFTSIGGLFWWIANLALFGKVFDEFESQYGKIDKGVFMGINAIFASPASSIVFFIFSLIIDAYEYDGLATIQTAHAKLGLRLGIGLLSLAFNVVALILILFMPKWNEINKDSKNHDN